MGTATASPALATLATARAGKTQRLTAGLVSLAFGAVTLALLPFASRPMPPMPGFVPVYQSALIVVYGLTTYLFLVQYRRTRSGSLLVLATGSLYVTLAVLLQMLSFPNVLAQGRILGSGPDTTTWLWTFWHLGPPLFALPYAIMEGNGRDRSIPPPRTDRVGLLAVAGTVAAAALTAVAVTRYVHLLPKSVEGDDYWLLTTSGVGPAVIALTVLALAVLCWTTRLRTVLQLWLAVSLFLLVCDNLITLPGAARGTVGWFAGRMEALFAGLILLGVYLREVDFLYARAEDAAGEREERRAELQLARDNLALALEAAEMGDWELDLGSGASRRHPRHDAIFGYERPVAAWDVETFLRHVVPEDRALARAALEDAVGRERIDLHCRIRRADDGAMRWIALRGKAYLGDAGQVRGLAGIVMDTTRQHEAEERLNQAQKMEAIGQLTGGVAHDFNNLLTIIVGNLDMIVRRPGDEGRVTRLAASGLQAAKRGAEVTEKLLAFSRRQVLRPETVNPNRLLKDFQGLLRRALGETIEVRFDLDASLDPVRLDPGQFESAVLNLAVNARDAMPGGGTLTVKTCNAHLDPGELADRPDLCPGAYVLVAVTDTGHGMDTATMARAFEPFFTTKDVGKGTGLGLSQVYGFVRQAGGHAQIKSESGRGTSVELYLPRSVGQVAESRPEGLLPLRRAAADEVVLVVEDEPAVLEMAVESLGELGYRTLTATQASEALDRLQGPERIDILFSDVVMPGGMNGVQLSVEARRLRPGLRVLLTSGYTGTALDDQGVPADLPLLSKPYQREELATKMRLVLGGA
ncbi:multi-sensor hybrid histidine kinase [Methylorubrum populi BJ001]|uniref:histidine kinase n=1 Tax=Methylorubrum populi (strain ATCC BAA-705 / NCIMB 13946 / BJ001) TaxID=441620 RepID=B1Z9G5_METPB|nr:MULTISPECIES: MASE4 domain-containing protein [Methylorubrum]ACB81929.1 multi-sensor hybrid histidine kinase [Methylorubrum populi BJ001]MBB5765326.1 signal transduction histidine kinase [Methylorubrum rhodesianum]